MIPWKLKVNKIIYLICQASYLQTNQKKNGQFYKKHRPYSVPEIAQKLINCLDRNDEEEAKSLMLFDYDIKKY